MGRCFLADARPMALGSVISLPSGNVLLDPASGGWVGLSRQGLSLVERLDGASTVEQLGCMFGPDAVTACLAELDRAGLLETSARATGKRERVPPDMVPYHAVLKVTRGCNLHCEYCYSPRVEVDRAIMRLETAEAVVAAMLDLPSPLPLIVEFHGGEPTIEFPSIVRMLERARSIAASRRREVCFKLQTNGTLLTDEMARILRAEGVGVGISLDGHREEYNRCRSYPGGGSALLDVLRGFDVLQRYDIRFGVMGVINRHNVDYLDEVFSFLTGRGITEMSFIPVFYRGRGGAYAGEPGFTTDQLYNGVVRLLDAMIGFNRGSVTHASVYGITAIVSNLLNKEYRFWCHRSPCGAGAGMLAFDVNGDVYPCDDYLGLEAFNCGNVVRDGIRKILASPPVQQFRGRVVSRIEGCRRCEWRTVCCGGCASSAYFPYGTFLHASQYCSFYKWIIPHIVNLFVSGVDPSLLLPSLEAA